MRTAVIKIISNPSEFKQKLIEWSKSFNELVVLDSNEYEQTYSSFDMVLALDAFTAIQTDWTNAFEDLHQYQTHIKDWIFGYLSYDLKNDVEELQSENFDGLGFPDLYFFQPKKIFFLRGNEVEICYLNMCDDEVEIDFEQINSVISFHTEDVKCEEENCIITPRISKEKYLSKIHKMLDYIHRGDIYEANFCMEFYSENFPIDPFYVYKKLNEISSPPFASFFKINDLYVLSASPERFLRKEGAKVLTQPIKGTAKRSMNLEEDQRFKMELEGSEKERAENIMIVDLVRNDLSHFAEKGSVEVEELCKVYTFKQVHQLISTIAATVDHKIYPVEMIKHCFPMGSMTGAPKISAMRIIEELEETKRGIYSGAIGYFTPSGNFDFNVIIRSILFNKEKKYLSFSVGSAITNLSIPSKEYEECLVKAQAMFDVLQLKS